MGHANRELLLTFSLQGDSVDTAPPTSGGSRIYGFLSFPLLFSTARGMHHGPPPRISPPPGFDSSAG